MKEILLICALCLLPITTMAEEVTKTCNGGTLVTSHKSTDNGCTTDTCNEHVFCKSDEPMNWWSAWAWCESNHRDMATLSVMCPNSGNTCPNLKQPIGATSGYAWSQTPSSDKSYAVNLASSYYYATNRDYTGGFSFCD